MVLPLRDIVVLDLTRLLPGPYCTMILADMGARVIRIEDPRYKYAGMPPFYENGNHRESALNSIIMRNKESITLNLKNEDARQIFYKMVEKANVLIEGFRPGVAKRLGIDFETLHQLNPQLIYCSLTGYGQTGPYRDLPGHDINYVGLSGNLSKNRPRKPTKEQLPNSTPVVPQVQTADIGGSLFSTIGILGAIINQINTSNKKGEYIDISMLEASFTFNPWDIAFALAKDKNKLDLVHGDYPAYNIFRTKDNKFLAIGNVEHKFWKEFCQAIELADLEDKAWADGDQGKKIFHQLEERFLTKTQSEWIEIFDEVETCVTPINDHTEALQNPQIQARNVVQMQNHPRLGLIKTIVTPIHYKNNPMVIRSHSPLPGENTDDIMNWIGYEESEIKEFREKKCFG